MWVKVSNKCARLKWNGCQEDYIRNVCNGRCCKGHKAGDGWLVITTLPCERARLRGLGVTLRNGGIAPNPATGICPLQSTETGLCTEHLSNKKPLSCWLSPWKLSPQGVLIVRNRFKLFKCYREEPRLPTYVAYRASLEHAFGMGVTGELCKYLGSGGLRDILLQVSRAQFHSLLMTEILKRSLAGKEPDIRYQNLLRNLGHRGWENVIKGKEKCLQILGY